jgi:hypothetical protein
VEKEPPGTPSPGTGTVSPSPTNGGTPVSAAYPGYFPFTGTIQRVVVTVGDDGPAFMAPRKDKTRD